MSLTWRSLASLYRMFFPTWTKYQNALKNGESQQKGILCHNMNFKYISYLHWGFLGSFGKWNVFVDSHHPRHSMKSDLNLENVITGKQEKPHTPERAVNSLIYSGWEADGNLFLFFTPYCPYTQKKIPQHFLERPSRDWSCSYSSCLETSFIPRTNYKCIAETTKAN